MLFISAAVMWVLNWAGLIGETLTVDVLGGQMTPGSALLWKLALPAVVILVAVMVYLTHPARAVRRQKLAPFDPAQDASFQREVEQLTTVAGLKTPPRIMLRPGKRLDGQAFGLPNAYDMTFQLLDAVTATYTIAAPVVTPVTVTNGLFVAALDFGAAAFNGEARWLEISVKCAGDPGFTTLTPRQAIAPAPYALALAGLRTLQNASSPNVIGGYAGNVISDTVVGGTIGGGGSENSINLVTGSFATIGGGDENTANGDRSTIGGGGFNWAAGEKSTIGGGLGNSASAYSFVGGGSQNRADGSGSTIGGGWFNDADGGLSTIGGGTYNDAVGIHSTVPGGSDAVAAHYGELAYASGRFWGRSGNAQTSVYVLRAEVLSNVTSGELFLDELAERLTITTTRTLAFDILIVARGTTGESSAWRYEGVIENNGGVTAFIGTPTKTTLGEDDIVWDVDLIADDTNDALVIKGFTNQSNDNVRFVATVRTVEVAW